MIINHHSLQLKPNQEKSDRQRISVIKRKDLTRGHLRVMSVHHWNFTDYNTVYSTSIVSIQYKIHRYND
jgi:hypothetical protein